MKRIYNTLILLMLVFAAYGQKYQTEKTKVVFYSEAVVEDITAENTNALGIVDLSNAAVAFSVPIIDFEFDKSLMKEHFNEKYMETEKFPKATFQGKIFNLDPKASGMQKVTAKGTLTIHGVSKQVEIPGDLTITKDDKMIINSVFTVKLEDYNIDIPQILWNNIAEEVEVTLNFQLKQRS